MYNSYIQKQKIIADNYYHYFIIIIIIILSLFWLNDHVMADGINDRYSKTIPFCLLKLKLIYK